MGGMKLHNCLHLLTQLLELTLLFNSAGNTLTMLKYLNPTFLRMFIQPISAESNWRSFVANSAVSRSQFGNQFGRSFDGTDINEINGYKTAVSALRTNGKSASFFTWLNSRTEVDWATLTSKLSTTEPGIPGASGNPDYYIKHVQVSISISLFYLGYFPEILYVP